MSGMMPLPPPGTHSPADAQPFPYHFLSQQARFSFVVIVLVGILVIAAWVSLRDKRRY